MTFENLKHSQRERLSYLDQCFAWRGAANRRNLIERFGVSTAQAALDFKAYLAKANNTPPIYDPVLKTYIAAPNHQSLCPNTLHEGWAQIISEGQPMRFEELPRLNRQADPKTMSRLYRAMEMQVAIHVQYTSMSTGKDNGQWIVPSRFASDGDRIHLRAFSFKHQQYRDYIPVRIGSKSSFKTRRLEETLPVDEDWDTIVRIYLVPKSGLNPDQVKAVRKEYGFTGDTLCIETRKALEFYADRRWGLDMPNARLQRHSICKQKII